MRKLVIDKKKYSPTKVSDFTVQKKDQVFNEIGRLHFEELLNQSLWFSPETKQKIIESLPNCNEDKIFALYKKLIDEKNKCEIQHKKYPKSITSLVEMRLKNKDLYKIKTDIITAREKLSQYIGDVPEAHQNIPNKLRDIDIVDKILRD